MNEEDILNKKKKKVIGFLLTFVFLIATLFFIVQCIRIKLIPIRFIILISAFLLILFFIFLILDIIDLKKWGHLCKQICTLLLSTSLALGSIYMTRIDNALDKIDDGASINTNKISIMTAADSAITELSDLNNKKIGYQNAHDKPNADYIISLLNDDNSLNNLTFVGYEDYLTLAKDVLNGNVDAMIFTSSYTTNMQEQMEDFTQIFQSIASYDRTSTSTKPVADRDISKEPFTLYISGMDEMGEPTVNLRSDVNLLLMVNPLTNHIEMVSIPRDAYVPNLVANGMPDKLTHTGIYGIDATVETMEQVFGFNIDYYAKVSFTSLIEIVNTLNGIDANVAISFCEQDEYRSFLPEDLICLNAGYQTLNGKQALAYARHRKSYGDIERTMAQQEIIKAIINKILSPSGVTKVSELLEIGPKYVATNIPMDRVKTLINSELDQIEPWTFSTIHMENGFFEMYPTASMGANMPLSVYVLNRDDVHHVYQKYLEIFEISDFADFEFNLNDLNHSVFPVEHPDMLWTDNVATKIYQYYTLIYPEVPDEEDNEENTGEEINEPEMPDGEIPDEDDVPIIEEGDPFPPVAEPGIDPDLPIEPGYPSLPESPIE